MTRRRACARAAPWARSTARSLRRGRCPARRGRGREDGLSGGAGGRWARRHDHHRHPRRSAFYYAEAEHQQYLARNPHAHRTAQGTGVPCPVVADIPAEEVRRRRRGGCNLAAWNFDAASDRPRRVFEARPASADHPAAPPSVRPDDRGAETDGKPLRRTFWPHPSQRPCGVRRRDQAGDRLRPRRQVRQIASTKAPTTAPRTSRRKPAPTIATSRSRRHPARAGAAPLRRATAPSRSSRVGFARPRRSRRSPRNSPTPSSPSSTSVVDLPNVRSVVFKEQEGSYLVGVLAGDGVRRPARSASSAAWTFR